MKDLERSLFFYSDILGLEPFGLEECRRGERPIISLRVTPTFIHAKFAPGDAVRVRDMEKDGHVRIPNYTKGKSGWISSVLGAFPNPESLAYGGDGLPEKPLYKVGF